MSLQTYDDAYYGRALTGCKDQLSNWVLAHEQRLQADIMTLPSEALNVFQLPLGQVQESQYASLYRSSSFFRCALLQSYVAEKICLILLAGRGDVRHLSRNFPNFGNFFTENFDKEILHKKVLQPCIELSFKMSQESRILLPIMIPAGFTYMPNLCDSLHVQATASTDQVLLCTFPALAGRSSTGTYVIAKAAVHLTKEWKLPTMLVPVAAPLAGLDAIVINKPKAITAAEYNKESAIMASTIAAPPPPPPANDRDFSSGYDQYAKKDGRPLKLALLALSILALALLAGLIAAAVVASRRSQPRQLTGLFRNGVPLVNEYQAYAVGQLSNYMDSMNNRTLYNFTTSQIYQITNTTSTFFNISTENFSPSVLTFTDLR